MSGYCPGCGNTLCICADYEVLQAKFERNSIAAGEYSLQVDQLTQELTALKAERDELKWHFDRIAKQVIPGENDTGETVIAMLKEHEALKLTAQRYRKALEEIVIAQNSSWIDLAIEALKENK